MLRIVLAAAALVFAAPAYAQPSDERMRHVGHALAIAELCPTLSLDTASAARHLGDGADTDAVEARITDFMRLEMLRYQNGAQRPGDLAFFSCMDGQQFYVEDGERVRGLLRLGN